MSLLVILLVSCLFAGWLIRRHHRAQIIMGSERVQLDRSPSAGQPREVTEMERPPLDVQLLTVNEYSRPGIPLEQVNGLVIHYTANPGTSAKDNRDYFEGLKNSHVTKASSHFIIGLDGEIVQCIPCNEWAYASNERNEDTISIECCIPDESGEFTRQTYDSLVELVSWLCFRYSLTEEDLLRHYDITGKNCPKYYVEHEDAWNTFREDVKIYMEKKVNE
ncbi:MAG: N-acetylmuramoyl-L-alanine amidase [Lachnospiraceae bacterium]|nr:N-acetylmuramoyl-L-alanine amidase [Lachnospiraceae bacterium]